MVDQRVEASCHCGAVRLSLSRSPDLVVECNCSLCRRYGPLWAYYEAGELSGLPLRDLTDTYAWGRKNVDFHRCKTCGCLVLWSPRASSRTTYGINARLLPPDTLSAARIQYKNGAKA